VKVSKELEKDPARIAARLKQVAFGKNTVGYDNYVAAVPREKRGGYQEHPRTPDAYEAQSKRAFDGKVKAWRRGIHRWDTDADTGADADAEVDVEGAHANPAASPMKVVDPAVADECRVPFGGPSPSGVTAQLSGSKAPAAALTTEQLLQMAYAQAEELADYSEDDEDVL
jgi:hypothetical protein